MFKFSFILKNIFQTVSKLYWRLTESTGTSICTLSLFTPIFKFSFIPKMFFKLFPNSIGDLQRVLAPPYVLSCSFLKIFIEVSLQPLAQMFPNSKEIIKILHLNHCLKSSSRLDFFQVLMVLSQQYQYESS